MSWVSFKKSISDLRNAQREGEDLSARWTACQAVANALDDRPPFHLRVLRETLDRIAAERGLARDEVIVLDHGCGAGYTVLYLLAIGYTACHGVDLDNESGLGSGDRSYRQIHTDPLNEILGAVHFTEKRFHTYDGKRLPLDNSGVDLVFSQQVLEHVFDDKIDAYFTEEARVLRPGGVALHQIPHRLVPYDSHTQTWLVHYLPRPMQPLLYRLCGNDPDYVSSILALRWPWSLRRKMKQAFGNCTDLTERRLAVTRDFDMPGEAVYDGSRSLRKLIDVCANAAPLSWIVGPLICKFVMLEAMSTNGKSS